MSEASTLFPKRFSLSAEQLAVPFSCNICPVTSDTQLGRMASQRPAGVYDRVMIRILTVCTGNICRSPYAERFLQKEFDSISPESFAIRSAGTHALVGREMDERAAAKLSEVGGSHQDFMARQLAPATTSDMDLVLALTEEHRNKIVALSPRLLKRSYTVREFAAVIEEVTADPTLRFTYGNDVDAISERWGELRKAAPLKRHAARVRLSDDLDVVDPFRQDDTVYDRMVEELLPALQTIVEFERSHSRIE